MATELLATGSTAASSTDLVVADGATVTVSLKGYTSKAVKVKIELKDDAAAYNVVGSLESWPDNLRAVSIAAPGTYRFTRTAGDTCGVFSA
ncbi:MAG: hypothetical protein H5U22_01790 [Rhizobium sp.]|nr:hypothetical protein [Rhizobium sp.]